jgi:tRNA(Ile)-lysidine synthetase-like protein
VATGIFSLLRGARTYDLAQPWFVGMPHYPTHSPFLFSLTKKHGDQVAPGGVSSAADAITFGGHVGTHMDALCHYSREGRLHGSVSLPGKIAIRKTRSGFVFEKEDTEKKAPEPFSVTLAKGINHLGEAGIAGFYDNADDMAKDIKEIKNIYKLFIHKTFYSDKINGGLFIRSRRSGDVIRCEGMSKTVKKLLCEKKVPPAERGLLPFICDGGGILWVPGIAVREGAEAPADKSGSNKIFYIFYANK